MDGDTQAGNPLIFEENMYGKIPGVLNISSYKIIQMDYQCPWKQGNQKTGCAEIFQSRKGIEC